MKSFFQQHLIIFNALITFDLCLLIFFFFGPVIQAFQVHVGAEEESASLARERKHPGLIRTVPGVSGQRHDRVRQSGQQLS